MPQNAPASPVNAAAGSPTGLSRRPSPLDGFLGLLGLVAGLNGEPAEKPAERLPQPPAKA